MTANDKTKKTITSAESKRIDVGEDYECRYWSDKFGATADELKRAVSIAGDRADDVARELGQEL